MQVPQALWGVEDSARATGFLVPGPGVEAQAVPVLGVGAQAVPAMEVEAQAVPVPGAAVRVAERRAAGV